jgi:hypothetical protein
MPSRRWANPAKRQSTAAGVKMLPWAASPAKASPATTPTTAAVSLAPILRAAAPRLPPLLYRPLPLLLCGAGLRTPPPAASSDGDAFWEEPDDGSGSDYEDEAEEETERRGSSRFPSSSPFSRLEAARQQEQELRRGICWYSQTNLFFFIPYSLLNLCSFVSRIVDFSFLVEISFEEI